MDQFLEIIQAIQDDKTIGNESTLFPLPLVKRYINRSYRNKAAALFRWPELEDAKKTSTRENQEYYDYPINWQADSIWKLKVNGIDYGDPLVFKDYLHEVENEFPSFPTGERNVWSSQWRRFFIRIDGEIPSIDGNNNICVWGQKVPDLLVEDEDVTIFSYSMPEGNEAIVLETIAMLNRKGENQSDQFVSLEAKAILTNAFNKIRQNQNKYEKTQPFFEVPDMFARGQQKTRRGNFN